MASKVGKDSTGVWSISSSGPPSPPLPESPPPTTVLTRIRSRKQNAPKRHVSWAEIVRSSTDDLKQGGEASLGSPRTQHPDSAMYHDHVEDSPPTYRLLEVQPHEWVRDHLLDVGHWEYRLRVIYNEQQIDNFKCRYTTLIELCQYLHKKSGDDEGSGEANPSIPERHSVPFVGKLFQSAEEAQERANGFTAYLAGIFNPVVNKLSEAAIQHVYEEFQLEDTTYMLKNSTPV